MAQSPNTLTDPILTAVSKYPEGVGVATLHPALGGTGAPDTTTAIGCLRNRGQTARDRRATRYRLAPINASLDLVDGHDSLTATAEHYILVSPEGQAIKIAIRRPLHERSPCGYDIRFLEAYEPNRTFYLASPLREQLTGLGRADLATRAPAGTFARDILAPLLIDLSWASSHLEGNTYTGLDTERLIEFGRGAPGKDAFETQMVLNHKAAIEFLVSENLRLTVKTILALHALLSDGLLRDPAASGRVRRRAVEISGSVYRPAAMPQRLEELLGIVVAMAAEIGDPIEQAFF